MMFNLKIISWDIVYVSMYAQRKYIYRQLMFHSLLLLREAKLRRSRIKNSWEKNETVIRYEIYVRVTSLITRQNGPWLYLVSQSLCYNQSKTLHSFFILDILDQRDWTHFVLPFLASDSWKSAVKNVCFIPVQLLRFPLQSGWSSPLTTIALILSAAHMNRMYPMLIICHTHQRTRSKNRTVVSYPLTHEEGEVISTTTRQQLMISVSSHFLTWSSPWWVIQPGHKGKERNKNKA